MVEYISLVRAALIVLVPLTIGILARYLKFPKIVFKSMYLLVLWVAMPALVFGVVAVKHANVFDLGAAAILALIGLAVTAVLSSFITGDYKMNKERSTAIFLNSCFMNYTFVGLAVVYAVLPGVRDALGIASMYAVAMGIAHLTVGVALAASSGRKKVSPREVALSILTFPAAFALIVALIFVAFNVGFSVQHQSLVDMFTLPVLILMLLAAGYQMPMFDPRKYMDVIAIVGAIRLIICPVFTFFAILLLGYTATPVANTSMILAIMPPGIFNLILAQKFGLDLKMYGAIIFYLTIASLFVALPWMVILLNLV